MHAEMHECDRCGSAIVVDGFNRPRPFQFVIDDPESDDSEQPMYESVQRILCKKCEMELLDWIDEEGPDRSDKVDLPEWIRSARALREVSGDLDELADLLESELSNDGE